NLRRRIVGLESAVQRHRRSSLRAPVNLEWGMAAGVLGKRRRDAPRTRSVHGSRVKRVIGTVASLAERQRRQLSFDLAVDDVGPVPLNADERCADRTVKGAIWILPAALYGGPDLIITWLLAFRRIQFRE